MATEIQREQVGRVRYLIAVLVMMAGPSGAFLLAWLATLGKGDAGGWVGFAILLYLGIPATIASIVAGLVMVVRTVVARRGASPKPL
jgi:hypothetical protein